MQTVHDNVALRRRISLPTSAPARAKLAPFLVYVCACHLTWIAWPYLVYPRLVALGERTLVYAVLNLTIRVLVWVAPVFLYLRFVDNVEPLRYLKLRPLGRRAATMAAVLTAINLLGSIARRPSARVHDRVTWNSLLGTSFLHRRVRTPHCVPRLFTSLEPWVFANFLARFPAFFVLVLPLARFFSIVAGEHLGYLLGESATGQGSREFRSMFLDLERLRQRLASVQSSRREACSNA